jgi:integrase
MCRTSGTGYAYRTGILRFLDYVNGRETKRGSHATGEAFEKYEKLATKYLKEKRDNAADLVGFITDMNKKGIPPRTINIRITGIHQFLIENDIEFTDKDRVRFRRVKPKGGRRTNIKYADVQILRDILGQSDTRLRALILVLASSGIRIGEALNLKWSEVRIPARSKDSERDKLTELFIRDSKNQTSRKAWITREAEEALLAWKIATPAYNESVLKKSTNLGLIRKREENYVFPFGTTSVYTVWDRACKAAGHYTKDETTKRNQLNIHRLRGFFKTQTMSVVPSEISELLMGHSDPYGNAYNGLPDSKLEQEYQKCERTLTIATAHGVPKELAAQNDEINNLKSRIQEMQETMRLTNLAFQNQMAKMLADLHSEDDIERAKNDYNNMSENEKAALKAYAAKGSKIVKTLRVHGKPFLKNQK